MIALLFELLFLPLCALLAGCLVWIIGRNRWLDDGELFRYFVALLVAVTLFIWGGSRTDSARMYLDPQFRLETELNANPIYSTVKRLAPDDFKKLDEFLLQQMAQGETLNGAVLQARSLLTKLANDRLGFADQKSRVFWGRITADSLKELQAHDTALCYLALASQPLDKLTLSQSFSVENSKQFQQAIIAIYESANLGMSHQRPADDQPVEFNDAALEFRKVQQVIETNYGRAVAEQIAKRRFPETPAESKDSMCAARILQLEQMLERPKGMAAMLIDSVLR